MNQPLDLRLGKDEFLRWAEAREGRYELKEGRVVMMTGGSKNHGRVTGAVLLALARRLDPALWSVTASDIAVDIGDGIRYPDILAEPMDDLGAAHSTKTPVFIGEILSPSSLALDLHIKAAEYMSLPSLECYFVAAQDEPRVWVWQRGAGGVFPAKPAEFDSREKIVGIACLGVSFPLAEIYRAATPGA